VENGLRMQARRVLLQQVAPTYRRASEPQRQEILDVFVADTGYARKYALWLLNHAEEVLTPPAILRRRYGPEVEEALVLVWNTLNRICAKRLVPFLPDILETLEEGGHLELNEEHRRLLLSMSAATADRLLQAHRYTHPHGLTTTKAGSLLKQQIPIRTFAQWDEARPGFLEVDLVAHCGGRLQDGYLYTITLTDIATGWTECLPLLNRGREAVLAALQRARTLFPFPILGLDTDNGGEFMNEDVAAYCVREQITFTRGRPYEKRDQCFVEQKNGVVVRQVVGHGRLAGEHAYRQLNELYHALHWYVNCFQPSMKLVSKQLEGRKIHRIYDAAKTPLQRVLLSRVLSPEEQQELHLIRKAFDPLRLFQQVEQLQQATVQREAGCARAGQSTPQMALVPFDLAACAAASVLREEDEADEASQEQQQASVLNWRRTSNDPFAGRWEQILTWVQASPARSSADILRELQSLFPECYNRSHLRTLQRGIRKIRTHLLQTHEEASSTERLQANRLPAAELQFTKPPSTRLASSSFPISVGNHAANGTSKPSSTYHQRTEASSVHPVRKARETVPAPSAPSKSKPSQRPRHSAAITSRTVHQASTQENKPCLTIERAIQQYLQAHRAVEHRPKTLQWHQTALGHLHTYLLTECHLHHVHQITEETVKNWLAQLSQTPTRRGVRRSASTIETYARSARAFCSWLVERSMLSYSPMSQGTFPRISTPLPHLVSPTTFEQVMRAGFPQKEKAHGAKRTALRDQALLWVLFETGITVSEVRALHLTDLDQHTSVLRVRGKGGKERQMPLGSNCLSYLRSHLRQMSTTTKRGLVSRKAGGDPLFGAKGKQPLSKNGVSMIFARLRNRAGVSASTISPQSLRHSFALRYLQAGGDPHGLQELMGYEGMAPIRHYLRWQDQWVHDHMQQGINVV
jgi:site-specific recombinase XerD